jgi:hypothetical protein
MVAHAPADSLCGFRLAFLIDDLPPFRFFEVPMRKLIALTLVVCLSAFAFGCNDTKKTSTTTKTPDGSSTTTTETKTDK